MASAKDTDISIYSINDLLDTYRNFSDKDDNVLYFLSELTGLSVDAILELL